MSEYSGRTAVVTGAGSGLGAAMADLFAGAGANVVLLDIDGDRAEANAADLRRRGTDAVALRLDVADKAAVQRVAETVRERFGAVHVLCANVGVQQFGAIDRLTDADWDWVLSVNFRGVVNTVGAFLELLRAGDGVRHAVLTTSASVFQFGARMGAYVASKFAVVGYGEVLRQELAPEGINVALLFPAGMATRHIESSMAARPAELGESHFDPADIQVMIESAGIDRSAHVASAREAVQGLLRDLRARHRYIFTHGDYRHQIVAQQQQVLAAFDRMME